VFELVSKGWAEEEVEGEQGHQANCLSQREREDPETEELKKMYLEGEQKYL